MIYIVEKHISVDNSLEMLQMHGVVLLCNGISSRPGRMVILKIEVADKDEIKPSKDVRADEGRYGRWNGGNGFESILNIRCRP